MDVYDLTVDRYLNFGLANGLIVQNSGKSCAAKREIVNVFLLTDDDIIISDPEAEYFPLVQRLGGQIIKLSPAGGASAAAHHINPMDINPDYSDEAVYCKGRLYHATNNIGAIGSSVAA